MRLVMGGGETDDQNGDRWWVSWWSVCGREEFNGGLGNEEETGKLVVISFFFSFFWVFLGMRLRLKKILAYKSSFRDSISKWTLCGKYVKIRCDQNTEIESLRLDL